MNTEICFLKLTEIYVKEGEIFLAVTAFIAMENDLVEAVGGH
jgi:hypothetical protein